MKRLTLLTFLLTLAASRASEPLNILFFTSDDMNHDSTAVCGGPIKDLTPHVDQLASQGKGRVRASDTALRALL
jgi:hypothetical protein